MINEKGLSLHRRKTKEQKKDEHLCIVERQKNRKKTNMYLDRRTKEHKNMRRTVISLSFIIYHSSFSPAGAQTWTMQQCMQYAVEHNHEVKRAELDLDNFKAQKTGAIGSFLPSMDASIGANYNFGRAIDPETNGYTDVSTFYNGYQVTASLPVFDGFSRLHALKAAKASELMGRHALRHRT